MNRERSPNYPAFSLKDSISMADKLYSKVGRSGAQREIAAEALGYASLNGSAAKAIAALVAYGLAANKGGVISLSELGLKIIRPINEDAKAAAIRESALLPKWFATIAKKYPESAEGILSRQLLHEDFTEDGARKAARIYKQNEALVGGKLGVSGPSNQTASDEGPAKTEAEAAPIRVDDPPVPSVEKAAQAKPSPVMMNASAADLSDLLPIPLDIGNAFIPKGMSEDDFQFLLDALSLYRRKLVAKPSPKAEG